MLSILWTIPIEVQPEGLAFGDGDDVSWDTQLILSCCSYVSVNVAITLSTAVLGYIAAIYHILVFWMPNVSTKLWFCERLQKFLPVLVTLKNFAMIFGALSLGLNGLAACGWLGIAAFLPLAGASVPVAHMFFYLPPNVVNPYMQQHAREFGTRGGHQ